MNIPDTQLTPQTESELRDFVRWVGLAEKRHVFHRAFHPFQHSPYRSQFGILTRRNRKTKLIEYRVIDKDGSSIYPWRIWKDAGSLYGDIAERVERAKEEALKLGGWIA
jgi:hypothetical protein